LYTQAIRHLQHHGIHQNDTLHNHEKAEYHI
jgi:hypothetical protein